MRTDLGKFGIAMAVLAMILAPARGRAWAQIGHSN